MKSTHFILIICLSLVAFGCKKTAKKAAGDYCECWQSMADIANLQDTLKVQGLTDSLANVTLMAENVLEEARNCAEEKKQLYGEKATSAAFNKKARKLMEKKCPEVFARTPKY
jgi:hypothetical protein